MPSAGMGRSLMGGKVGSFPPGISSAMFTCSSSNLSALELGPHPRPFVFDDFIAFRVLFLFDCSRKTCQRKSILDLEHVMTCLGDDIKDGIRLRHIN